MNKTKYILSGMFLLCLLLLVFFFVFNQNDAKNRTVDPSQKVFSTEKEHIQLNHIPNGWVPYISEKFNIAFAYPSNWNLIESELSLTLRGDGYDISLSQGNRGLRQTSWSHPSYVVSNQQAKTWEAQRSGGINGLEQIISIRDGELVFHIYTPDNTKNISDEILSTIVSIEN